MLSAQPLCICDDATFWPWLTWPEAARLATAETLVIAPIAGYVDRRGLPLDAEEGVLLRVLRVAARGYSGHGKLLVLPPLRFVSGPPGTSAFPVSSEATHAFLAEVVRSTVASGYRRVVLVNASPWNEALCDVAARDLRLELGAQLSCVHLSALGFDFAQTPPDEVTRLSHLLAGGEQEWLDSTGAHLARLLAEIARRPALRDGGRLGLPEAPSA